MAELLSDLRFVRQVSSPALAVSTKVNVDLKPLKLLFGDNFNTLLITNLSGVSRCQVYLNGMAFRILETNKGSLTFDWKDGVKFNFLELENLSASDVIAADGISLSIGRTGV